VAKKRSALQPGLDVKTDQTERTQLDRAAAHNLLTRMKISVAAGRAARR
jgi:hypothetical protein